MTVATPDNVVRAYIQARDEIDQLNKTHKAKIAELQAMQEKRTKWLQQQLDASGQDSGSIKGVGTYFKKKSEYVSVADMEAFISYLKENEAWDLLNKAVNKSAALERLGEDRDLSRLPFLKYSTEEEVQVRRS